MKMIKNKLFIYILTIFSGIGIMIKNELNWGSKITSCTIAGALIMLLGEVLVVLELYFNRHKN